MMGYEQMNQMTMKTTTMMKNFNKVGPISTPHKKTMRRSVSAIDGGATAEAAGEGDRGQNLETLDLSGMSLASLPASSINLASISKLDLSNNNIQFLIQQIPESLVARMLNLWALDLHSNQLKTLPNSIGCLSKLKILNVSGNNLQALPKTIEDCRSLEELNANFNELTLLPDTIGFELTNLTKLSVNSNKLVLLPSSLGHLTSLRVLDARLNCLVSLPEDLENLVNLQVLNVSQNFQHLKTLPYSVGLLISLVELDVSYNGIRVLPDSIGCLRRIQKLSVEGNPLVSPPFEVVEHGLEAVKQYMSEKMTESNNKTPTKKKLWGIGKMVKYKTFHGFSSSPGRSPGRRTGGDRHREEREGFINVSDYRQIDGLASPRHVSLFNPRRLLSPLSTFFSPPRY
ncbi:plant intracellular Ras-group-related LRR protein 8 isoform X1 [Raphanus sativus]|uniref:Plant intracellular Ras-group-related LRR protein 8 isoform X1 n=1 Tax=Raphanus sativus TaxID=3726 RepID=A0A9W3CKV7_RAPSA|nr:plant intracellular Ras-group-related LRR protein 8 isoform X1 [Raphanus sativus]